MIAGGPKGVGVFGKGVWCSDCYNALYTQAAYNIESKIFSESLQIISYSICASCDGDASIYM